MRSRGGAVFALLVAILVSALSAAPAHAADPLSKVLVFSKTAAFRHDSIPQGIAAIQKLGTENNFTVDATEDATVFTDANLAQYDVIVFMSTTGDILNNDQQGAFERYMHNGGGFAGVHAASDTEYTWPYYGQMLGAYFKSHPAGTPQATVHIEDSGSPSTTGIPTPWIRSDEWYNFQKPNDPVVGGNQPGIPDYSPRTSGVHVLATVDESTYDEQDDNTTDDDHPIAWCSNFDGGRVWYTGMGHTQASFTEANFVKHLLGGLKTAAKNVDADCGAERQRTPSNADFEVATLAKGADKIGEPIALDVLPDRRVLHTARDGRVFITTPNSVTTLAAQLNVYSHDEDGLQGVAVDPNFATNKWVYLFYAPRLNTPMTDAPSDGNDAAFAPYKGYNLVSRFKLGDDGKLVMSSEQEILRIPTDRGMCCHVGGDMDFDAQGNLFIATGDDSNPFSSDGYTPIDDRANRNPVFDARRTSGSTNDLRGKVLRIKVGEDGSYTVPAGNLFPAGQMGTKPEIYAMGFRNPFRFSVDKATGNIYLGEYGPDAGAANANRGPGGLVEFNLIKEPGNYGWPYCIGKNQAFNDYDFATGTSGAKFNCAAPVNDSRFNTGLTNLPPAKEAWIDYDGGSVPAFGSGSESPMGGPTYRFDAANPSTTKFPAYFNGKNFAYEYGRGWIKTFTGGLDGTFPQVDSWFAGFPIKQPIDMNFGPDGALYVLDYGTGGFFQGDANSAVYRIDYVQGARSPIVKATADKTSGPAPLTVKFSAAGSIDPDGTPLTYKWDFDGDGTVDSTDISPTHTYATAGRFTARLTVTDATGQESFDSFNITAGNTAPTVKVNLPAQGAFFEYGDKIKYTVTVTDPEDGTIDCSKVLVNTALGHNDHSHGDQSLSGCSGEFTIPSAWEDKTQHVWYIVSAQYTDKTTGLELTGSNQVELEWKTLQAEQFDANNGFTTNNVANAAGGQRMGYTDPGDWLRFDKINMVGINTVSVRTSGPNAGTLQLRADSPTGPIVATVPVVASGDWEVYKTQDPAAITDPGGTRDLYLVAVTSGFDIDELTFNGPGANGNAAPNLTANASTLSGPAPLKVDFTANAVDPEGTTVSYAWNFGVPGATATTANASYTYTQRGIYTATVTATDADGRKTSKSFQIEVLGTCPGTDTFTGTTLDRTVWPTITREDAANYKVENGVLKINAVAGDIWTGAVTAKNVVSRNAPSGPWTATTKVSMAQVANGEQAAIILSQGTTEVYKTAFIRTAEGRNVEFVGLRSGAEAYVARSAIFPADAGDTIYLRMQSDGTNLTVWFSRDGVSFTQVGAARPMDRMTSPLLGVSAFNGTTTTPASFEWFNLSTPTDEFDGTSLSDCRWTTIVRPTVGNVRVAGGELQIDALDGDLYNGTDTAKNIVLQPAPQAGKWEATTKVKLAQGGQYEQGGLVLYKDAKNFAKVVLMDLEGTGWRVEFGQDINGVAVAADTDRSGALPAGINETGIYLKLISDGTNITAQWSADGTTWTSFGRVRPLASLAGAQVGLAGYHGTGQPARFDFFRLGSGNRAPVISAATASPATGTAPLQTQFDVTATDADGDTLTYAWDLNGDGSVDSTLKNPTYTFTTAGSYTAKVTVSDGKLTAEKTVVVTVEGVSTSTPVEIGSNVAPTLSLQLGTAPVFGQFLAGVTRDYTASTTAEIVSSAGDAMLSIAAPGAAKPGYLSNGAYSLAQPLQVRAAGGAWSGIPNTALRSYTAPTGKDVVALDFKQSIAETDPLRSGRYGTTVVLTLSTTTP